MLFYCGLEKASVSGAFSVRTTEDRIDRRWISCSAQPRCMDAEVAADLLLHHAEGP